MACRQVLTVPLFADKYLKEYLIYKKFVALTHNILIRHLVGKTYQDTSEPLCIRGFKTEMWKLVFL